MEYREEEVECGGEVNEKDRDEGKQGGVLTSTASGKAEAQPNDGDWRLDLVDSLSSPAFRSGR